MSTDLTPDQEHFLSYAEVQLQRGLEEVEDQEYRQRLWDYCVACQVLAENVQAAVEIGGEPMRLYLQQRCGPVLEAMQAVITQLTAEMENSDG